MRWDSRNDDILVICSMAFKVLVEIREQRGWTVSTIGYLICYKIPEAFHSYEQKYIGKVFEYFQLYDDFSDIKKLFGWKRQSRDKLVGIVFSAFLKLFINLFISS